MIKEAIKSDSSLIERLHSETLSSNFLASLGQSFLNCLFIFLIKNNKMLLEKMSQNAHKLAETKYDKFILCKEFAEVLEQNFIQK